MKNTQKEEENSSHRFNTLKTRDNTPQDYNYDENDCYKNIFSDSEQNDNFSITLEVHQGHKNSNENDEESSSPFFNCSKNDDNMIDVNTTVLNNVSENQFQIVQESNQERIGIEIPQEQVVTISEENKKKNRKRIDNMNERILTFLLKSLIKYVNQKSKKLYQNKYKFRAVSKNFFHEQRWQKNRQNVLNKPIEFYLSLEINGKYITKEKDINKKTLEILKTKDSFKTFVTTETLENIYINMFLKENSIDSNGDKMENIFDMIEKEKENHDHLYIELLEESARKFIKH
jgi:hypothetical protein